eukprot:ANDGO_03396.mRNA.1 Heat shock 70 kDa protein
MIGISIGRFSFSVAVYPKGIVANPHGSRTTPTRVSISSGSKPVVGESAVNSADEVDSSHPQFWPAVIAYAKEIAQQVEQDLSVIVIAAPKELVPVLSAVEKNAVFVDSAVSALLAYDFDESEAVEPCTVSVLDYADNVARWSQFTVSANGLISPASETIEIEVSSLSDRLVAHFGAEFYKKTKADYADSRRAARKLKNVCFDVKHRLSAAPQSSIELDSFFEGIDFFSNITRAKFEMLIDDVLAKIANHAFNAEDVSIILAGGGCRVPRVRSYIKGTALSSIPSDEVFAIGAAKQASIIASLPQNQRQQMSGQVRNVQILPYEVGLVLDGDYTPLFLSGSMLPLKRQFTVSNSEDDQDSVKLVFAVRKDSNASGGSGILGTFVHRGGNKKPKQTMKIEISVEITENGKLTVRAQDKSSGTASKLEISLSSLLIL